MKELYLEAEMDIEEFDCEDVIATSSVYIRPDLPTSPGQFEFW